MRNQDDRDLPKGAGLVVLIVMITATGCGSAVAPPAARESAAAANTPVNSQNAIGAVERRIDGVPVTAVLRLAKGAAAPGDEIELSVELNIAPMWEVHARDAQPSLAATRLNLSTPAGVSAIGEWKAPATARSLSPDGHPVYMGKVVFTRLLTVDETAQPGESEIACDVAFQACNDRQCLEPRTVVLNIPLVIEPR